MISVLELRQYTLHPGQREVLINLFDREFVETQEAVEIRVLGQFRDLDHPDRFVWLRGFPDLPTRASALTAFYGGPAWRAHRSAANATMTDVGNVLLLHPLGRLTVDPSTRDTPTTSLVLATIYDPADPATFAPFLDEVIPLLAKVNATPLAVLETDPAPNNFPALPIRTGEHVFVLLASFPGATELAEWFELAPTPPARVEHLRLAPTSRLILR